MVLSLIGGDNYEIYRFCVTVTVLLVFGFGIFGRGKLATYTNITVDPNFINDF